jgi:hypothetical protein
LPHLCSVKLRNLLRLRANLRLLRLPQPVLLT